MRSILLRATAYTAGVLGGVCLVVRHLVDSSSGDVLAWVAAAFLAIAGLGLALKLVPTAPKWLQGVVSVGVVALVASVWVTLRRSEEHTSELQSLMRISYAVFCLKKKKK